MTINIYLCNNLWTLCVVQNISSNRAVNHAALRTTVYVLKHNKCDNLWKFKWQWFIIFFFSSRQMAFYIWCSDVIKFIHWNSFLITWNSPEHNTERDSQFRVQNIEVYQVVNVCLNCFCNDYACVSFTDCTCVLHVTVITNIVSPCSINSFVAVTDSVFSVRYELNF